MSSSIFFEIHRDIPREGPGDSDSTKKAFEIVVGMLPNKPQILDVGCGPGMQTLELAKLSGGSIIAIDSHQPFLDELENRAAAEHLSERIRTVCGDMFQMKFQDRAFDLIWSEGAIFIIGLEKGFREWKRFLKPNGYISVTHLSWLRSDIPKEPMQFWMREYPQIRTIPENLDAITAQGYKAISHFVLPESAWWDDYYTPLQNRLRKLRVQYGGDQEALKIIEDTQREIDLYKSFSDYYGFVFYIARRG